MKYITLSSLGALGGVGSQLGNYAALLSIARQTGRRIAFSQRMMDGLQPFVKGSYGDIKVGELLKLDYEILPHEFFNDFTKKTIDGSIPFDKTVLDLDPNLNYDYIGRFDLYTYWHDVVGCEMANMEFETYSRRTAEMKLKDIKNYFGDKELVSIHVRRGDYLLPWHSFCELSTDYYVDAINKFKGVGFVVFSNDIGYVKDLFEGDNVVFIEARNEHQQSTDTELSDLALMSMCDHNVIANSSFSWWGAYLNKNPNKKVICPTNYLKKNHDLAWINGNWYPPSWINIDNEN